MRTRLEPLFRAAVASLDAERLVIHELAHAGGALLAAPEVVVLALGKPALAMARGAARVLPRAKGLIVAPASGPVPAGFELLIGEHPLPDAGSLQAGVALLGRAAAARTAALFLVAGGGSALACAPVDRVSLLEKQATTRALLQAGAPIAEVNAVRKHLSRLKGGRLAAICPAGVRTAFILSDVVAGGIDAVASGPTVPDPTTFAQAVDVLERCRVPVPQSVADHLERGARALLPETPKPGEASLAGVESRVLAGVDDLARAAAGEAERGGWKVQVVAPLTAEVEVEAERLARELRALSSGSLLVAVGEPTVRPVGGGDGGRAQHLALLLAKALAGEEVEVLAAGSDGRDYTTGAAGAIVDGLTWRRAEASGFGPEKRLARFDSGGLCAQLGVQIPAFESGTNLGDLVLCARL